MNKNFDIEFDRHNTKCRKWDFELVNQRFGVSKNFIPMHIADMDFPIAKPIVDAVSKRAAIPDYGYTYAYDKYYEAVINWNKRRHNIEYKKEWIKLMFGTNGSTRYAVQCFCKPGDSVLINTPVYGPFAEAVYSGNCKLITSPLKLLENRYFLDFEDIEKKIVENKVKVYIFCNPHNPGGRVWTDEELYKLCEICIKHNVLLVSDEVHCEMIFGNNKFITMFNAHPNIKDKCIVCSSPNKAFNLGGLKSSYMIISNDKIRQRMLDYTNKVFITSPHIFIIPAIVAAYNECEQWLDDVVEYIDNNFKYFYSFMSKHFPKVKVMENDSSYLAWTYFGEMFNNEDEILNFFKEANIAVEVGSHFVSDGNCWVRFNLGMPISLLKEALNRLI